MFNTNGEPTVALGVVRRATSIRLAFWLSVKLKADVREACVAVDQKTLILPVSVSFVVEVSADQESAAPKPSAAVPVEFTPNRATVTMVFVAASFGKTVKLPVTLAVDGATSKEPIPVEPFAVLRTPAAARVKLTSRESRRPVAVVPALELKPIWQVEAKTIP